MSLDASGTIAGAIVFSKWKGRPYVRRHAIPANPRSGLQVSVRAMLRFLAQWWGIGPVDATTWAPAAADKRISAFNEYVAYNMLRWRQYKGPSVAYPADMVKAAPGAPTTTPTGGVHSIQLSIAAGADPGFAWLIHRSLLTGFTPGLANVVAAIGNDGATTIFIDHPLTFGTYYYRIRGLTDDGVMGTLEAQITANAT